MKIKVLGVSIILAATLLSGCGANTAKSTDPVQSPKADVVTTASLVNEEEAFVKAISKDGTWIVAILADMTINKELVIEGEFHDKNDTTKPVYRKLALYAQDEDHKVTARYTLTAPKLMIKNENTKIQGGTFKGDVYVQANGFNITDGKVDGNVYFASDEYKASFKMEKGGTVTGATEVKK